MIIPLWRRDKFKVGDMVVWSESDSVNQANCRQFGEGPFRVTQIEDVPYSPDEDILSRGYPLHAALGHTQYVWVDQPVSKSDAALGPGRRYTGLFFRKVAL
jgi:hypothetical protein